MPNQLKTIRHVRAGFRVNAEQQRDSQHSLVADKPNTQTLASIHRSNQRDDTIRWKVNVPDRLVWRAQLLCSEKFNRFATLEESSQIGLGERGQQRVFSNDWRQLWQISTPNGRIEMLE